MPLLAVVCDQNRQPDHTFTHHLSFYAAHLNRFFMAYCNELSVYLVWFTFGQSQMVNLYSSAITNGNINYQGPLNPDTVVTIYEELLLIAIMPVLALVTLFCVVGIGCLSVWLHLEEKRFSG